MTANQDIIDTIIDAMNQPRRQAKAVTFLERIAKDGEMCVCILQFQPTERPENIGYARQLMLNISLLDEIAKLGKNIIRKKSPLSVQSVFGPAFTAVGKKTVVGDRGTLSAVRAALEVFASHGMPNVPDALCSTHPSTRDIYSVTSRRKCFPGYNRRYNNRCSKVP